MIDKEDVGRVLPLSCVESYFIAWVKSLGIPDGLLYNKSFISFDTLIQDFLHGDASYEHYGKIERVMTTAAGYGFTSHTAGSAIDKAAADAGLYLIEVNERFFENCALKPWRKDHYICINKAGEPGFSYVNQFPLSDGLLPEAELAAYFGGKSLLYTIVGNIDTDTYVEDENAQFAEIVFQEPQVMGEIEGYSLKSFRDCTGIMRVTRRRLQSWLRFIASERRFLYDEPIESFFDDYFKCLDLLFVRLEAANLRNKPIADNINDKINEIAAFEKKLAQLIRLRRITDEHTSYF
jgi:hypothetical protein